MVANLISELKSGEYICSQNLNLYVLPNFPELATQIKAGRQLKIIDGSLTNQAIKVCSCEDNYSAWLKWDDRVYLQPASQTYQAKLVEREKIVTLIPEIIKFTYQAMDTPNYYLWGGTVAPNYDCSGLMQSAFASMGVWLPRDSYQQEAFTQRVSREDLTPGDLIFFGDDRVNHVALYLGENKYIHSSCQETGNNGIGINYLDQQIDRVSGYYGGRLWSFGRVSYSFVPSE